LYSCLPIDRSVVGTALRAGEGPGDGDRRRAVARGDRRARIWPARGRRAAGRVAKNCDRAAHPGGRGRWDGEHHRIGPLLFTFRVRAVHPDHAARTRNVNTCRKHLMRKRMSEYAELIRRWKEAAILGSCGGVLGWDERTYMPRNGSAHRAEQMALVARL